MKNVLVISKYFYPLNNTRSYQAQLLVNKISESYNVDVVTRFGDFSSYTNSNVSVFGVRSILDISFIKKSTFLSKFFKRIENDIGVYWSNKASKLVEDLISNKKYDVILSLSETFDSHLVVYRIRKKIKSKWVVFFSDPWPHSILPEPYYSSKIWLLPPLQRYFAKSVLRSSDHILCTSPNSEKVFRDGLNVYLTGKFSILPHLSPDMQQFDLASSIKRDIVHAGTLNDMRVPIHVLECMNEWLSKNSQLGNLVFYGNVITKGLLCNSFSNVKIGGNLTQSECLRVYEESNALLIIEANMDLCPFIPSKFVEYCLTGLPIIAIVNKGSHLESLLVEFGNGIVIFHTDSKHEIFDKLNELINFKVKIDSKLKIEEYYDNNKINLFFKGILND